jgi:hypothetical protein
LQQQRDKKENDGVGDSAARKDCREDALTYVDDAAAGDIFNKDCITDVLEIDFVKNALGSARLMMKELKS